MKKNIYVIKFILILCMLVVLGGCTEKEKKDEEEKLKVVTTIFPPYDFARAIAGDQVELSMLLKPGAESHSYEPTPQDILKIQDCDVFIYVGGESDEWVRQILESVDTKGKQIITLMDMVEPVKEETVEGMQEEHLEEQEEGHEMEYDEHVWTSPINAVAISEGILKALKQEAPEHAKDYEKRAAAYEEKLKNLDKRFRELTSKAKRNTIVVGDRFPFRYFVEAYGLKYYAAFPGCVAESEPSAATVAFLIDKVKSEKIPVVFTIELSNGKMSQMIAEETGAKICLFHSCHNLSAEDFEAGETYLSLMEKNYKAMKEALQ